MARLCLPNFNGHYYVPPTCLHQIPFSKKAQFNLNLTRFLSRYNFHPSLHLYYEQRFLFLYVQVCPETRYQAYHFKSNSREPHDFLCLHLSLVFAFDLCGGCFKYWPAHYRGHVIFHIWQRTIPSGYECPHYIIRGRDILNNWIS